MKFKKTVVYMRYSSVMQDDGYSIEYQRNETKEYAQKLGLFIDGEYIDEAKSGTKVAGRDGFYNLIRAVKNGEISAILVYKMSRMFRNAKESEYYRDLFRKFEVRLVSATEYINEDTSSGRMTTSLLSVIDQYQSEITSDQVRSSMREMSRQGFFTGGVPPFGYTTETIPHGTKNRKRYIPHTKEAEILKKIFKLYASGYSINGVVDFLNKNGYKTRKGNWFCHQTLMNYLQNEAYIGILKYKAKGYDEVVVPDAHPALVSKSLFDLVQKKRKSRQKNTEPRRRKHFYPLTGKILCVCGSHYCGVSLKRSDANPDYRYNYVFYKCRNKHAFKSCSNRQVHKEPLETAVLLAIKSNILNEKCIDVICKKVAKLCENEPHKNVEKIAQLKARSAFLIAEIDLLIEMRRNKELSPEMVRRKSEPLEQELLAVENSLKNLKVQNKGVVDSASVKSYLLGMLEKSKSCNAEILKSLFDNFVEKIIVLPETVELHLRVLPDQNFIHNRNSGVPVLPLCINLNEIKTPNR